MKFKDLEFRRGAYIPEMQAIHYFPNGYALNP